MNPITSIKSDSVVFIPPITTSSWSLRCRFHVALAVIIWAVSKNGIGNIEGKLALCRNALSLWSIYDDVNNSLVSNCICGAFVNLTKGHQKLE